MDLKRGELFFSERKKGQITIFVIAAILIVAIVGLFFLFRTGIIPGIGGGTKETNVNAFLNSCIEDKIKESVNLISLQGGYTKPVPLSVKFRFQNEDYYNISYLCYTSQNYVPCVNQNSLLIQNVEDEIKNYISNDVETCFNELKDNFEKQGFDVAPNSGLNDFNVELVPKKIAIKTDSEFILTKTDETTTQENFEVIILSRSYEILQVVQEIANQEAEFCNFNLDGFMLTYPEFEVEKFSLAEKGVIYTVKYIDTNEKFRFAIRSCFIPPGFIAN
ncbi:hypothetical protein HYT25_03475 [Candidatus Pacearchaeota archaeon]|nr:hypothetical protein [Candidatus Pacearchaeota archaeon]